MPLHTHKLKNKSSQKLLNVVLYNFLVAARVMDKERHIFKKTRLQLRFFKWEKHNTREYKPKQLAISGLPKSVEKDVIEVVIADRLDMDEEDDFVIQVSGQSAIITFVDDHSTEGIPKQCV